jgi:hypothetical protein
MVLCTIPTTKDGLYIVIEKPQWRISSQLCHRLSFTYKGDKSLENRGPAPNLSVRSKSS